MRYNRILLKLSGEALVGDKTGGIDPEILIKYSNEIKISGSIPPVLSLTGTAREVS